MNNLNLAPMKIEIVKHFDPEDTDFYGDYYVTVENHVEDGVKTPHDELAMFRQCNTDEAEAFANGYAQALLTVGFVKVPIEIIHVSRADADEDVG